MKYEIELHYILIKLALKHVDIELDIAGIDHYGDLLVNLAIPQFSSTKFQNHTCSLCSHKIIYALWIKTINFIYSLLE